MTDTEKLAASIVQHFRSELSEDTLKMLDLGTNVVDVAILQCLVYEAYSATFHCMPNCSEEEGRLIDDAWRLALSQKGFTPCH